MNLLAKSCFAPGLIAMISNLIASSGDIDKDINDGEWFNEYGEGMEMEIYAVPISNVDYPDNISFNKIADIAYSEFGAVVFALEIQSKNINSSIQSSVIRLNPSNFIFKDWHMFNYSIFMVCESEKVSKSIQVLEMPNEKYERLFGRPRVKKEDIKGGNALVGSVAKPVATIPFPGADLMGTANKKSNGKKFDPMATANDGEEERTSLIKCKDAESAYSITKKSKSKLHFL